VAGVRLLELVANRTGHVTMRQLVAFVAYLITLSGQIPLSRRHRRQPAGMRLNLADEVVARGHDGLARAIEVGKEPSVPLEDLAVDDDRG
jgi:hypothetical protein